MAKHVVDKIERLFKDRQKLKKNKDGEKKVGWTMALDYPFEIAHANSLNMVKMEGDKEFLLYQRQKGRSGKIGSLDKRFVKKAAESINKK